MFSFFRLLSAGLLALSRPLLFGGLLVAGAEQSHGQMPSTAASPPRRHSLSLEAQSVTNGGKTDTKATAQPGTYGGAIQDTRVVKSQQNVQFSVRNFGPLPDTVSVEWYFTASPVGINGIVPGKEYLLNQGSQDLTIEGNKTESQTVSSKEVGVTTTRSTESTANVIYVGKSQGGAVVQGWMVRLLVDGRVIATKGSSQKYEDLAKDEVKIKALASQPGAGRP